MRAMADLVRSLMRARTVGSAIAVFVKMILPNRSCGSLQVFWRSSHGELPSQTDIRPLRIFCADAEYPDRIIILFVLHLAVAPREKRARRYAIGAHRDAQGTVGARPYRVSGRVRNDRICHPD
jgi:hypothetical protein